MEKELRPKIIHEDENILIINKPSGLVVHPFDYSTEYTLVNFLLEHYPNIFSIKNNVTLQDGRTVHLGGIVHKLDRNTSGILVITKNQKTFDELKDQFKNHKVQKTYVALVEGIIEKENFIINAPLGRNKKDYKQSVNPINLRGELREAITKVEVVERGKDVTLVKLSPVTGRTHQLRAHMAHIGHHIVGDVAYGSNIKSEKIMLHAESLKFELFGEKFYFEVKTPKEFGI